MNRVGLLGVVLAAALLAPASAAAAPVAISITGPSSPGYDPAVVGRSIGASFQWTNNDSFGLSHTVTQGDTPSATPGPSLFDSNAISSGSSFLQQLTAGGVYNYFCKFHPSTMHGKIKIRDKVSPTSGPPGTKFTITIATVDATGTRVYDVQKRINGGAWTTIRKGITLHTITVTTKTTDPTGTYEFRSRVRDTGTGAKSDYSPPLAVTVT